MQRREGQDGIGNDPSEGPETNGSPNTKDRGESCVYHDEVTMQGSSVYAVHVRSLGMSEIARHVTRGDPVMVRESESHRRKSAES